MSIAARVGDSIDTVLRTYAHEYDAARQGGGLIVASAAYHRGMSRLIRMDQSGHTTLAEWTAEDPEAVEAAVQAFRRELDRGYYGVVTAGPGKAEMVRELPVDAELVIMRAPIAGGDQGGR